jgi:hypothetical protein
MVSWFTIAWLHHHEPEVRQSMMLERTEWRRICYLVVALKQREKGRDQGQDTPFMWTLPENYFLQFVPASYFPPLPNNIIRL